MWKSYLLSRGRSYVVRMDRMGIEHQGFAEVQRQSQEGYMKVKTYAALQYCKQQVIKRLTECLLPGWLATVKDPCFVTFIWGA